MTFDFSSISIEFSMRLSFCSTVYRVKKRLQCDVNIHLTSSKKSTFCAQFICQQRAFAIAHSFEVNTTCDHVQMFSKCTFTLISGINSAKRFFIHSIAIPCGNAIVSILNALSSKCHAKENYHAERFIQHTMFVANISSYAVICLLFCLNLINNIES